MSVRVRIAPSPTGFFHIGTARTALFNYLFARKHGGIFVLRIEDTDKERSTKEYEEDIYASFEWLGLSFDEKYVQSEHVARHQELLTSLVASGKAYVSREPAKDDPSREVEVVRLRNPGRSVTFTDVIRGDITFDTTELGDFVIARSITDPLYHFAVVADDGDAGITHVIRGEDHISNTPRQILIQEALGLPRPVYAHLPLILAPDRTKMSKRKHQTSMRDFRAKGYLPEAMINFIALLGWSEQGSDREMFTLEELVEVFTLEGIHKGGAVFNEEKLRWFNREYLLALPDSEFRDTARDILKEELSARVEWNDDLSHRIIPVLKDRIHAWNNLRDLVKNDEVDYYFKRPDIDPARIPEKKSSSKDARRHLTHIVTTIESLPEHFSHDDAKNALWGYASKEGRGAVLWPMRYALCGKDKSPDPFVLSAVLGRSETLARLQAAMTQL